MMMNNEVTYWSELRQQLPDDLPEDAVELVRRSTAPVRHRARVAATVRMVLLYFLPSLRDGVTRMDCQRAADVLELDIHGAGGPLDAGGPKAATARMTWTAGLGTGRRQARDGGAWMSAAQDAMMLLRRAARASAIMPEDIDAIGVTPKGEPVAATPRDFYLTAERLVALVPTLAAEDRRFARSFARGRIAELARQAQLDGAAIRRWAAALTAVDDLARQEVDDDS